MKNIKWVAAFLLTFGVILGLWRMSGAAMGQSGDGNNNNTQSIPTPTSIAKVTPGADESGIGNYLENQPGTSQEVQSSTPAPVEGDVSPTSTGEPLVLPTITTEPLQGEPTVTPTDAVTPSPTPTEAMPTPTPTASTTATSTPVATATPVLTPTDTPVTSPALAIKGITATYIGEDRIVTNDIIKTDVEVYVHYTWDSIEPELIPASSITLKPGKVNKVGENVIEVWYDKYMTTITVTGLERKLVNFEAKYIGAPVYTGTEVDRAFIKAVATYNDGIKEDVTDFVLLTSMINTTGVNSLKVTYGGFLQTIYVDGIVEEENLFKDYPIDSDETTRLTMLVSNEPYANSIYVKTLAPSVIRNAVDRVVVTDKFLGFEVMYDDPEAVNEFPIYSRIIRPDDYDPDKFGIYYTPNRKTIMAKVEGEYIDAEKKQYVFRIYEPGTYVMLEEISHKLVTSINVEKTYIKLKINRNYSLLPVVLPETADDTSVTYTSTDTGVAVVSRTGKITSVRPGECDIIISACDESGVFITVHVEVTE